MTEHTLQHILDLTLKCANIAGAEIVKMRENHSFTISTKPGDDLVTSADIRAEQIIIDIIRSNYPDHSLLCEESSYNIPTAGLMGPVWIIDPIDGTMNYSKGHMHTAISIAFMDKGELQVGVVYAPFLDETYFAIKGQGAYLNGKKITATPPPSLSKALIGLGSSPPIRRKEIVTILTKQLEQILFNCADVRRLGAASVDLCWVASGKLHAFYEYFLNPWDIAAGKLVCLEAGLQWGHIRSKRETPFPDEINGESIVVAHPEIFKQFLDLLQRVDTEH